MKDYIEILKNPNNPIAIFILYLIIAGNYTGELFGCRLQEIFTEIAYVKHIIAFLSLHYFVNLTTPTKTDPVKTLIKSFVMYLLFMVTRNVSIGYTIIFLLSMFVIKFLEDYKSYHYKSLEDNKEKLEKIENTQYYLNIIIYLVIFIGFIRYTINHINTTKQWSWESYLLGPDIYVCDSLKDKGTLINVKWF
tara:strand:- start:210 stop:785 length:576 start_codon:yes stop_codon:yes gene_type:complete